MRAAPVLTFVVWPQVGTFKYLNIADTPCYRETLLYSITAALSVGLLQFMLTSESECTIMPITDAVPLTGNIPRATSTSLVTMSATSLLYYSYCRHKLATDRFRFQQIKLNLRDYVARRGRLQDDDEDDD